MNRSVENINWEILEVIFTKPKMSIAFSLLWIRRRAVMIKLLAIKIKPERFMRKLLPANKRGYWNRASGKSHKTF